MLMNSYFYSYDFNCYKFTLKLVLPAINSHKLSLFTQNYETFGAYHDSNERTNYVRPHIIMIESKQYEFF